MILLNEPRFLLLLLSYPFLIALFYFKKNRGGRLIWGVKLWHQPVYYFAPRWPKYLALLSHIFYWLGITGFILAMANPTITHTEKSYINKGAATMIVLDESPSMAARDFGVYSRFEAAQMAIKEFIESRENDEVGLLSFSREAALRVPLTQDYKFLLNTLENIKIMELGDGTSIGMGLALAALHLSENNAINKNIFLITDGANNSGEIHPDAAINILVALNIKVYTIGLGRKGTTSRVNIEDPTTGFIIDAEIKDDSYDETLLALLAERTQGYFFRAETLSSFENAFQTFDAKDTAERRFKLTPIVVSYRSKTLFIAVCAVLMAFFMRTFLLKEVI